MSYGTFVILLLIIGLLGSVGTTYGIVTGDWVTAGVALWLTLMCAGLIFFTAIGRSNKED